MKTYDKIFRDVKKYIFGTSEFGHLNDHGNGIYPIDLSFTLEDEDSYYSPKDKDGIPYKVYSSVGDQYNPARVAAYSLAHFNRFVSKGDRKSKEIFLDCADWFLSKSSGRFEYFFDWGRLRAPWISCMTQGEAASVLIRGYRLTQNFRYLECAEKSLEPFFLKIQEDGVQSHLSDGSIFLEEYPSASPTHVLNGFMFSLIGLAEFVDESQSEKHKLLLNKLIISLNKNIYLWNTGKWSLYEDPNIAGGKNFCTPSYQNLQISQLIWLVNRIDFSEINGVIHSWEKGVNSLPVRLYALLGKLYFRLRNKAQR